MILVDAQRVNASRPGRPLFRDLSLTVSTGDRLGIVGINGCGKSTLLRVLAGQERPESGEVRMGRGARVAMLAQEPVLAGSSVHEAAGGTWESDSIVDRLGLGQLLDTPVDQLSGGQAKRVALARALVEPADLLILDEPTNHLDLDAIAWLEERLAGWAGGLVLVTHDRHVLDRVTNRVIELDRGDAFVHEGGYDAYLDGRAARAAHDAAAETVRRNLARTELAWLRRGAPARTSKPKARIASATAIVEGGPRAAAREGELDLHLDTPRLGDRVIELHGVGHRFGEDDWLFRGLDLAIDPGERLGVVGRNGAGKSTLLAVLGGRLSPREGRVDVGSTVRIGWFDQMGRTLDPDLRVRDAIAGPHRQPDHRDRALAERFWFDGDAQHAPIRLLSGGERRRLQLLMVLAQHPNVLLLDEPTNDLDLDTLRALEDFLDDWPGAVIVVSHDRALLERAVADVIICDGEGTAGRRPGGYAAYEQDCRVAPRRRGAVAGLRPAGASGGDVRGGTSGRTSGGSTGGSTGAGAGGSDGGGGARSAGVTSPSTLRHRMREIERRQATLGAKRDELTAGLAAVAADHERLAALAGELAAVDADLAAVDEAWLELAAEAEDRGLTIN